MVELGIVSKGKIVYGLKLFNEKARKLAQSSFTNQIMTQTTGVKIKGQKGGIIDVNRKGPSGESIDAFVLTFRFFIQKNEPSSFRKLASYYNSGLISEDYSKQFNQRRDELNEFLNQYAQFKINGKSLTRREIMMTFVYGDLAHSDKKSILEEWKNSMGQFFVLLEDELIYVLGNCLGAIFKAEKINERALETL